jgi:hypothetical protein
MDSVTSDAIDRRVLGAVRERVSAYSTEAEKKAYLDGYLTASHGCNLGAKGDEAIGEPLAIATNFRGSSVLLEGVLEMCDSLGLGERADAIRAAAAEISGN